MINKIELKNNRNQTILLLLLLLSIVFTPLLLHIPVLLQWDQQLFLHINSYYQPSFWDFALLSITQTGSLEFLFILDVALFIAGKRKLGTYLLILLISYSIVGYGMKLVIDRPRPYLEYTTIFHLGSSFQASFPSGHSLGAAAFSALLYARKNPYFRLYFVIALFVFFTRVFLGMHYPLDVFSGALIGSIIGLLVGTLNLDYIQDYAPLWKEKNNTS